VTACDIVDVYRQFGGTYNLLPPDYTLLPDNNHLLNHLRGSLKSHIRKIYLPPLLEHLYGEAVLGRGRGDS
jgi:hypothetical protein